MGIISRDQVEHFLIFFPILLISVALHEFAHCWTDDRLGDDTPRRHGRVTLNPLAHLDPLGTLMMAVTSFTNFGFGWGKPSPFNPNNFRHPERDRMIGALAGPASNIIQMLIWASLGSVLSHFMPVTITGVIPLPLWICYYGIILNAGLAVFNLLPIYPLDGHHILSYLAPKSWRPIIDHPAWQYLFLVLVFFPAIRDSVLLPIMKPASDGLLAMTSALVGWPYL